MAALTKDRKQTKTAHPGLREPPVAANVVIFEGSMVAIDSSGYARPARTNTTDRVLGICDYGKVDNSTGAAGALRVKIKSDRTGCFGNSASTDLIALKDIGSDCFAVDDQTVALTNGSSTRVRAGKVYDVTPEGVWVRFDQ